MNHAPRMLQGVPYLGIEELLFRHERKLSTVQFIASSGQEALSIKGTLDSQKGSVFMKIFRDTGVQPAIMRDFLQKIGLTKDRLYYESNANPISDVDYEAFIRRFTGGTNEPEPSFISYVTPGLKQVERQAIAFSEGKKVLPDRIPQLMGVLTYNGIPIGIMTEFVEGEGKSIMEVQKLLKGDIEVLKSHHIITDDHPWAANAIVTKGGGIKLVDLTHDREIK